MVRVMIMYKDFANKFNHPTPKVTFFDVPGWPVSEPELNLFDAPLGKWLDVVFVTNGDEADSISSSGTLWLSYTNDKY